VPTSRGRQKSKLISICGKPIAGINAKGLEKFCTHASIANWRGKAKYELCLLIIAYTLKQSTIDGQVGAVRFEVAGDWVPGGSATQSQSAYYLLINILFTEDVYPLYTRFYSQPTREDLDKGRKQNQALCEMILAKFNFVAAKQGEFADEADTSDDDDDDGGDIEKLAIRLDNRHIDPSDVVTMESWQHILKMINRLHSDYKKLEIDWKERRTSWYMEDLLEGMKQDFTRNREEGCGYR
jgi:hypothetical protein